MEELCGVKEMQERPSSKWFWTGIDFLMHILGLSNHTHFSPTDPDSRISTKPGKARQLNYFAQMAVDDTHHVITGACADFADQRDSQCLPKIMDQVIDNLSQHDIQIEQITADTGYSSGESLKYCEEKGLDAWIPNFGQYKSSRTGFEYNKELDQYECQRGHKAILSFKGERMDSKGYIKRTYRSSESDCGKCPFREECCGKKTKFKKIDDSIHKEYYDRMHEKLHKHPEYAKRISRIRSKTVEPVLGTLLNFMNMRRVNTRGIKQANKHIMMAAMAYNLQKYLRFVSRKPIAKAEVMQMERDTWLSLVLNALGDLLRSILRPLNVRSIVPCFFGTWA